MPHEAKSFSKPDLFGLGWFWLFIFCLFVCLVVFFNVQDLVCCIPVSIEVNRFSLNTRENALASNLESIVSKEPPIHNST